MYLLKKSITLPAWAVASAMLLAACGGGSSDSPGLTTQNALTASANPTSIAATTGTSALSTSGGSGSGAVTYKIKSGSCTVSSATLTASSTAGPCVVTATKAADATYSAASADVTVTVLATQTITAVAAPASIATGATSALSITGGSGTGAVSYTSTGGCTIAGTTLTAPSAAATCVVTAKKAADATYAEATSNVTVTVTAGTVAASTTFVTFDEATAPTLSGFGALTATIATDPAASSNKVAKLDKLATGETWAGVTLATCPAGTTGSMPTIPLSSTNKTMSLRAYSPTANTEFRLKLENSADATKKVEAAATVTAANTWETLTFDFGSPPAGTDPLDLTIVFNKASVFPNFNNKVTATYYVDDLKFLGVSGVSQTCPATPTSALPMTFDDSAVTYTLSDFGGNASVVDAGPSGSDGKVAKSTKGAVGTPSQTWAGTTVTTGTLPFAAGATTMTVRVWAPNAGTTVRLKAENLTDATVSVETDAVTTVASGWQTLTFNFANQATGTAALNLSSVYGKVSIFFDFNIPGTGQIYYFDTVKFGL